MRVSFAAFGGLAERLNALVLAPAKPELKPAQTRKGGRVVKCTGLENRQRRKSLVGSNPSPSATYKKAPRAAGPFAFRYRIDYSSVFAKFIAAGMSGSWVTSGTTWM